jgi:hypothetical protein
MGCADSRESRACATLSLASPPDVTPDAPAASSSADAAKGEARAPSGAKLAVDTHGGSGSAPVHRRPIVDLTFMEALQLADKVTTRMQELAGSERTPRGGPKMVDLKLSTLVSKVAHPLLGASVSVEHLSDEERTKLFAQCECPPEARMLAYLELPVAPKGTMAAAKFAGQVRRHPIAARSLFTLPAVLQVVLIANQDGLKASLPPSYLGLKKFTIKEGGQSALRLAAAFSEPMPMLEVRSPAGRPLALRTG